MRLAGGNALTLYEEVVRHPWPNAEAHKEYGIALAEANRNREARCELTEALKGADTGDIYLALALLSTRLRDPVTAYKEALACLRRWPGNREVIELIALLKKESHSK